MASHSREANARPRQLNARIMQSAELPVLLPLLLLSLAAAIGVGASAQTDDSSFTPAQLARARERLAQLYDDGMDADKDGKLTHAELSGWLASVADKESDADIESAWQQFNLSDGATAQELDWDQYAASRMSHSEGGPAVGEADAEAERIRLMQDEVRRAIEEASRETGLDKTGIRVSLPGTTKKKGEDQQQQQQQKTNLPKGLEAAAMQLARDRRRWEAADEDGDGRLSRQEFRDFAMALPTKMSKRMRQVLAVETLERLDSDADGRVSEAEFLGAGGPSAGETSTVQDEEVRNFRQLWDTDKSGHLDVNEVEKMLETLETPGAVHGGKDPDEELHDSEAAELLKAADTDGDGSLSRAEVTAGLETFAASSATNYGNSVGIHDEL